MPVHTSFWTVSLNEWFLRALAILALSYRNGSLGEPVGLNSPEGNSVVHKSVFNGGRKLTWCSRAGGSEGKEVVAVVAPRTRDGRLSDEVGATSVVDAEEIMYPLRLHLRGRDGCSEVMMVWSGVVERERGVGRVGR